MIPMLTNARAAAKLKLTHSFSIAVLFMAWLTLIGFQPCQAAASSTAAPVPLWMRTPHIWRIDDGLPQNVVKCEVQAPNGYLWVATQEGIGRFDGARFTNFTTDNTPGLASNNVHNLLFDKTGALWILAGGGLTRYADGQFTKLIAVAPGMDSVQDLWLAPDGGVMVACERSLRRWNGHALDTVAALQDTAMRNTDAFMQPVEDRSGAVWMYDRFEDIVRVDADGGVRVYRSAGPLTQTRSRGLCIDSVGTVWAAADAGLYRFIDDRPVLTIPDSKLGDERVLRLVPGLGGDIWVNVVNGVYRLHNGMAHKIGPADGIDRPVLNFDVDNAGVVYAIGFDTRHLYMWDGRRFEGCITPEPICLAWVNPILEDRGGGIWIGTYAGLCSLRNTPCRTFGQEDGLPSENVRSVCVDRSGALWVGTDDGDLCRYQDGRFSAMPFPILANSSITVFAPDLSGGLWLVANGAPYLVSGGRCTPMSTAFGLAGTEYVQSLAVDAAGGVWVGTPVDILRAVRAPGGRYAVTRYTARDGAPADFIPVIYPAPSGDIWIGANKSLTLFKDGVFRRYDTADGLPSVPIIAVHQDRSGGVWIGSWGEGLYRLKSGRIRRIGVDNGLYASSIQGIEEDGRGSLVIASSKGLFAAALDSLNGFADGILKRVECQAIGRADGAVGGVCSQGNQPVMAVDGTGAIWAAAQHGAMRYSTQPEPYAPAPTYVEDAAIDGVLYDGSMHAVAPPGSGSAIFHFTSVDFDRMGEARFKYILEGFDKQWQASNGRRDAVYTNLPPGSYRFRVTEIAENGEPVGSIASMGVKILPHWYETGWFKLNVVCGFIALGFALGYMRMRQLARQNRLLEARVKQRTGELVEANESLLTARDTLSAQNDELQALQAELEAQNDELQTAKRTLEIQNEELNNLATTDGLTGLTNRRAFRNRLDVEFKSAARYNLPLTLVLLDVDHFKQFNDIYGHQAGDDALVAVAAALTSVARETDLPARYGGEEFAVILPHTDSAGAAAIAERLRETVAAVKGLQRDVTVSVGVAAIDPTVADSAALIELADKALYESKHAGRNRVTLARAVAPGLSDRF